MKATKLWISNLPEGIGHDATEAYLADAKDAIAPILRGYDAVIIGQVLVCDDGCEEDIIEKIQAVLTPAEGDDEDPILGVHPDQFKGGFQHAQIVR